ncbi:DUF5131 family protein [Pirellulales bacterium]|nr:DUF5131 family protein [Pirellulales bacterium]
MKTLPIIDNKTILTKTSGFLDSGFTHSINAYSGCSHAGSLCGLYCYAQHNQWITKGRPWKLYGAKRNVASAYRTEYDRLKRPRRGNAKPLRIYMSSSTDPYVPQERTEAITQELLREMVERPPDALVIQTHSTLVERDIEVVSELALRTRVWLSVTVETDMEHIPGFPPHVFSPAARMETIGRFHERGVPTRTTVSPLCPLNDAGQFAERLKRVSDEVTLDHYLLGDGTNGLRTKRTEFPELLEAAGYGEWNSLEKFWSVVEIFRDVFGEERIGVSAEGFNRP